MIMYDVDQAHQSNFRLINLVTQLSESLLDVSHKIDEEKLARISRTLVEILCQANHTGRSLGGVLTPNKAVPQCKRGEAKAILSVACGLLSNQLVASRK